MWILILILILLSIFVSFWISKSEHVEPIIIKERNLPVPEIQQLNTYLYEFQTLDRWENLLAIGDIYRSGVYPRYRCSRPLALQCYRAATMSPDHRISFLARAKFLDASMNPVENDHGMEIPKKIAISACQIAHQKMLQRPVPVVLRRIIIQRPIPPLNNTDSQNVHDHSVVKTVHKNLESLPVTAPNSVEHVRDCVLNLADLHPDDKIKALMTLDDLDDKNIHSTFGVTEVEALDRTWAKIQGTSDSKTRTNLEEMLGRQLASAVENGHVVCSTGKISRIVDTFQGITEDMKTTKTMSAVSEELGNLAAKIREECLRAHGPMERQAYESGQNPGLEVEMKTMFKDRATKDYVDGLGMSPEILSPLLEPFVDAF